MRIIAGEFRGRALTSVGKGDAGAHLRPTTDRVRESLFNVLSHIVDFDDSHVLDMFAGTGALGLEALSRGGAAAVFVDDGRISQGLISKNIDLLRVKDRAGLIRRDATRLPANDGPPADLVFLDPPYGKSLGEKALATATSGGWIADDALIVWEESTPMQTPDGYSLHDSRKYGDTYITLMWRDA
ncbi:16S rRNA (guanine(966)-N(2))-methyltransferase RsmD [Phaeobacter sp. C3_T13_0]|uniref:16S rRNA (guanine(966)-N(2))-methyltransferase RsmD n=1 Tax=Phaeobacter cretensis TaxID=3342641 RepID=UPI0039BD5409